MTDVRLVALDVDGTLVRRDGQIDERDRAAVAELQRRGVPVTIITGRLWSGTRELAAPLELQAPAMACADGAELIDPRSGTEIDHTGIAGPIAQQVREAIVRPDLAAFLMVSDGILHDGQGDAYARYVSNWSPELRRVPAIADHPLWSSGRGISAIVVVGAEDAVRGAAGRLRATDALEVMEFTAFAPVVGEGVGPLRALLIHARGVDKGTAVERVAERSGCLPSEVAVVGDWLNDIAMFRAAGRSFAMAQAPEAVRAAATDLLSASAEQGGGVAEAIACILRDQSA